MLKFTIGEEYGEGNCIHKNTRRKGEYKIPKGLYMIAPENYSYHTPFLSIQLYNIHLQLSIVSAAKMFPVSLLHSSTILFVNLLIQLVPFTLCC